jgi:hypothetical protein
MRLQTRQSGKRLRTCKYLPSQRAVVQVFDSSRKHCYRSLPGVELAVNLPKDILLCPAAACSVSHSVIAIQNIGKRRPHVNPNVKWTTSTPMFRGHIWKAGDGMDGMDADLLAKDYRVWMTVDRARRRHYKVGGTVGRVGMSMRLIYLTNSAGLLNFLSTVPSCCSSECNWCGYVCNI